MVRTVWIASVVDGIIAKPAYEVVGGCCEGRKDAIVSIHSSGIAKMLM